MKLKIVLTFLCFTLTAFSNGDFFSFSFNDLQNKPFSFSALKNNKATVIVFLLPDCPASQNYILTLNNFARDYANNNISIIGVFPGNYATDEELLAFRKEYSVHFPLLKDPEKLLVKYLHATIAPQCVVVDTKSEILYTGRIDNWMFAVGKKRTVITENNLEDALKSIVAGQPVKVKTTRAVGCIIE